MRAYFPANYQVKRRKILFPSSREQTIETAVAKCVSLLAVFTGFVSVFRFKLVTAVELRLSIIINIARNNLCKINFSKICIVVSIYLLRNLQCKAPGEFIYMYELGQDFLIS